MDRFFRGNPPRPGMPISIRGFASGVLGMANALSNARMQGGHIEWSAFGVPTFVVDPAAISDVNLEPNNDNDSDSDSGLPDGTEIWGRVAYDSTNHKFVQYKEVWNSTTQTFVESETATDIVLLGSHASQH